MKTTTKIAVGVGIAGIIGYLATKGNNLKNAVFELVYAIDKISKLQMDWTTLSLKAKLDLKITNPTSTNIGIDTASMLTVKQINLIDAVTRKKIGTAILNMGNISIPANDSIVLPNIPIVVPILDGVGVMNNELSNLVAEIVIVVFGKEYIYDYSVDSGTTSTAS